MLLQPGMDFTTFLCESDTFLLSILRRPMTGLSLYFMPWPHISVDCLLQPSFSLSSMLRENRSLLFSSTQ